jgi:ATP-dependent Clp protease ATP-binding subunit ClpA
MTSSVTSKNKSSVNFSSSPINENEKNEKNEKNENYENEKNFKNEISEKYEKYTRFDHMDDRECNNIIVTMTNGSEIRIPCSTKKISVSLFSLLIKNRLRMKRPDLVVWNEY